MKNKKLKPVIPKVFNGSLTGDVIVISSIKYKLKYYNKVAIILKKLDINFYYCLVDNETVYIFAH